MSDVAASDAAESALVDTDRYPLHRPDSPEYASLLARCRAELAMHGLFDLEGFLRPNAIATSITQLRPLIDHESFVHRRHHNIYFMPHIDGLAADHPALRQIETVNRTVCADQMSGSPVLAVYEWPRLRRFLADVLQLGELHPFADDLARVNVMSYREGEALNWHFDRSEFTTTLLLQQPDGGAEFEFRTDLRSDTDPNYDGVAQLLNGADPAVQHRRAAPGTLTVFAGRRTAHRVTPVAGPRDRIVAVFSYSEQPGVTFTADERIGFYGRA